MKDIELVIKIPVETYEYWKNHSTYEYVLAEAIANGTPLPEGHGDLIDADLLKNQFPIWVDNFPSHVVNNTISKATPIIEADKER